MGKVHLKKGRVAVAMAAIVFTMVTADSLRRDFFRGNTNSSVTVEGSFKSKSSTGLSADSTSPFMLDANGQPTTAFEGVRFVGYNETELPAEKLSQGLLVLVDGEHTVSAADKRSMVDLLDYKNEYYTLIEEGVMLNEDAAEALNHMMADYNEATGLSDFVVYGTTDTYTGDGSYCPGYFPECATGNTVDLALNGYGSVISYDGYDEEGWIVQNCTKYGFIVRYPEGKSDKTGKGYCPWHLRYVGKLHASLMEKNSMCLEEYLDFLKGYTVEAPYECTYDNVGYEIYYAASEGDVTSVRVPLGGNYSISGNNTDGYIITSKK